MTNGFQKLIKLDIVVQKNGYGIGILGKSCDEFTKIMVILIMRE